jgi:dTDP-4-dehydrorhamnose 3,5-epimerase
MNQKFSFSSAEIEGVFLIKPFVVYDERGYFIKDYSTAVFNKNGLMHPLKEVFYTISKKGVIRAIHFQRDICQAKLVRCISGKIYDVVVDLRKDSATFGKWCGYWLSEENKDELYVPGNCGHGYLVLEDSIVSYKCDEDFYSEYDDGIIWNDEDIKIEWPVEMVGEIILSGKDKSLQTFRDFVNKYGSL